MRKILYLTIILSLIIISSCQLKKDETNNDSILNEQTDKTGIINNDSITETTPAGTQTICDDSCKKDKAISDKDYDQCIEIKSTSVKNDCFYQVGLVTKNEESCGKISDLTLRNKCYSQIGYALPKEELGLKNTYTKTGDKVCTKNGVPIIRLYGASYCPHCRWVGKTFYNVAKEYSDYGMIEAYYWELNGGQNLMDATPTEFMSEEEIAFYNQHNSKGIIPYFNLGCIYERFGNGYEGEDKGLEKEEAELRKRMDEVIAKLIKQ